jgi:hypothetical protein
VAYIPDLPSNFESDEDYFATVQALEAWARNLVVLKYAEIENDVADTYLLVKLWLDAYGGKFPEGNFDNATLWVQVCAWLYGYVDYLEGKH